MIYSRWDVIAVHFPFVVGTEAKRRPGLIVSADRLHKEHGLYWIVMITTAKSGHRTGDIAVSNLTRAGLPENCVIRVARMTAISDGQIARRLGDIPPKQRNAVSAMLKQYLP